MMIKNRKISALFKTAKSFLSEGNKSGFEADAEHFSYICSAVKEVYLGTTKFTHREISVCGNIIMTRLPARQNNVFPHTVETYLREHVRVPEEQLTDYTIQQFRHRWLDSLVKEFDVDGYYKEP